MTFLFILIIWNNIEFSHCNPLSFKVNNSIIWKVKCEKINYTHKTLHLGVTTPVPPTTIPPLTNCSEVDTDISGAPIKIVHGIEKWEECAYLCFQDNKCQFWTWTSSRFPLDSFVGDCDLKERNEGRKKVNGIFSGTSDCGKNCFVRANISYFTLKITLGFNRSYTWQTWLAISFEYNWSH